jgi:hypothetical protein
MKILFMGKEDIDLFEILKNSETSRTILQFYEPQRYSCGVIISVSSLGIALSLVSELRWYVRRYMSDVLFEIEDGIYGTYSLAREVYERDIHLEGEGIRKSLYGIRGGRVDRVVCPGPNRSALIEDLSAMEEVLEVWSLEEDTGDDFEGEILPENDTGENPLREGL